MHPLIETDEAQENQELLSVMGPLEEWMPEGFLRRKESKRSGSERGVQVIKAIDSFITENDFDVCRYVRLRRLEFRSFERFLRFYGEGEEERAQHYARRTERLKNIRLEMQLSVFAYLLERGYERDIKFR